MKTTEQYFSVVLFIMLYKVDQWKKSWSVTIQRKATEQKFSVVLFIKVYKGVVIFESVDEILSDTNQLNVVKQYCPAVLASFVMQVTLSCNQWVKC